MAYQQQQQWNPLAQMLGQYRNAPGQQPAQQPLVGGQGPIAPAGQYNPATGQSLGTFPNYGRYADQSASDYGLLQSTYMPQNIGQNIDGMKQKDRPAIDLTNPNPNPAATATTTSGQNQDESAGEEGGLLSMLGGVGGIGAIAGLGTQLATNLIGQGKEREIWEQEKQNALAQTLANREGINAMNPEANRRMASMQVQNAMSGAQAGALNSAAGQGQYAGGDVGFAAGAGARNSAMAQQAISPMAQQLAGLYGQKAQEEMGKRQMLDQNSMQQAQIRDMNTYVMDAQNNPFFNLVQSATGGASGFGNIFDTKNKNQKVEGAK